MNSFFDDKEEIAWGPVTLKEIKFDLNRPRTKKVNKRHTTVMKKSDKEPEYQIKPRINLINPVESGEETMESRTVDNCSSSDKYVTAVNSLRTECCLQNAAGCVSDNSGYLTAAETTCSKGSYTPHLSAENTMCFVNAAMKMKTDFNLEEDIPDILVENTMLTEKSPTRSPTKKFGKTSIPNVRSESCSRNVGCISDSSVYHTAAETTTGSKNSFIPADNEMCFANDENMKINVTSEEDGFSITEGGVIIISSDDESFDEENYSDCENQPVSKVKDEIPSQNCDSSIDHENYSSGSGFQESDRKISVDSDSESEEISEMQIIENVLNKGPYYEFKDIESGSSLNDSSEDGKNILSIIPEESRTVNEQLTETRKNQSGLLGIPVYNCESSTSDEDEIMETRKEIKETSFRIPQIDFAQFDESSQLDDTIELMDRMLKLAALQEESASARENEEESNSTGEKEEEKENVDEEWRVRTDDIISGSFMKRPIVGTNETSPRQCHKSKIPTLRKKSDSSEEFRVPLAPAPQRTPKIGKQNANFKNIASPVGLYIKYSPQPLLRQNFAAKEMSRVATPTQTKKPKNKNADKEIGFVKYKPAKKQLCTSGDKLFCPPYIQKMIKDPLVTKHEKKIVRREDAFVTESKLLDDTDLTRSLIGDSLLNDSNQDVSILKVKTALRK